MSDTANPHPTESRRALLTGIGGLAAGALIASRSAKAGPLDPPAGPITPTPGPEPRIAINATNTPGDATSLFKITQSGSYYLAADIFGVFAAGKAGILIAASNVSIDLMGFEVRGGVDTLDGIGNGGVVRDNIRISNGLVRGWGGSGVNLSFGSGASGAFVERIVATANANYGILVDDDSIVRDCIANQNGGYGIAGGRGTVLQNCTASGNAGGGLGYGVASSVADCAARENGGYGFTGGQCSTVLRCEAYNNTADGFHLSNRSLIAGCTAAFNGVNGIYCSGDSIVRDNQCARHSNGAGILIHLGDNRVEGNNCTGTNSIGIHADSAGNFIARNTCSGNTLNWSIVSGNVCLVVRAVNAGTISGDSGGTAPGSTDPNANFTY